MAEKRKKTAASSSKGRASSQPAGQKATGKAKTAAKKSPSPVRKSAKRPAPRKSTVTTLPRVPKVAGSDALKVVQQALEELKAVNVRVLDVRQLTDFADEMVIASGNSDRHVRSIADRVVQDAKKAGFRPAGVEGERDGEWVLVDLRDIVVHIMLPRIREIYRLEDLWDISAARREAAERAAGR